MRLKIEKHGQGLPRKLGALQIRLYSENNALVLRHFFCKRSLSQLFYFVFNDSFYRLHFAAIFSLPFSGQTGAKSLRTSKLVPDVAFHVNYRMQVVWNANDRDSGRSGEKRDENRTSGPPSFEFKVHTSAWVYTYNHNYLGNCGAREPVVLFN